MSTSGSSTTAHRSGPVRSDDARWAILVATADQFLVKGYERLTIQGVAAAAKVGKQTIYRWWAGKAELLAECLVEGLLWDDELTVGDTGDLVRDVSAWLAGLLDVQRTGVAELLRSLLGAAAGDEALASALDDLLRGQLEGGITRRFQLGRERGEVSAAVDTVLAIDLLLGLVMVRTLTQRASSPAEVEALVRRLLAP